MAPPRTPNVYAALEHLNDEPKPEPARAEPAGAGGPAVPAALLPPVEDRIDREMEWSALSKDAAAAETGPSWAAMGAEAVGPEVLRWRREDDDIVPSGGSAGRSRHRLQLRRRSAA